MAQAYGFASSAGVDLPAGEQTVGTIAGRENRLARWKAYRSQYCADAKHGSPDVPNRTTRTYLTRLASENCTDGWRYRAGDNADLAIGQGETTVSPLQLAVAYSALVNGGTVYQPTFGWAEVNPAGKVVRTITPQVKDKLPVSTKVLSYIRTSLHFVDGAPITGAAAFRGSPIKTLISGKTGTAEVYGKAATSWLATFGPSPAAKFVVVGMIEQAGTGASAAGPMVRQIWNGLLGVGQKPVLTGSTPATTLPTIVPTARPQPLPTPSPSPSPTKTNPTKTTRHQPTRTPSSPTRTPSSPTRPPPATTPTPTRTSPSSNKTGTSTTSNSKTSASKTSPPKPSPPKTSPPKTSGTTSRVTRSGR